MKKKQGVVFAEFRRLAKSPMTLLSVFGLLFIPLLYSGMLIGAFWDPYGKLDRLPVAVVNQDAGAEMNGETIRAGQDLIDELKKNAEFQWKFTDENDAAQGLKNHRYALAFVIPADFSKQASTLQDETPHPAEIRYYVDDGWNYLNSKIGSTAADQLRTEVGRSVTRAYAKAVLNSLGDAANGFKEAGDGAAQLADGAKSAQEGALRLQDNLAKLADGTLQLEQGMGKLKNGTASLAAGAQDASSGAASLAGGLSGLLSAEKQLAGGLDQSAAAAGQLAEGTSKLAAGASSLADGAGQLAGAGQSVSAGADQLAASLEQYAKAHEELAADESFQKLIAAARQVKAGADRLGQGAAGLQSGAGQLADSGNAASAGAAQLQGGLKQLQSGMATFGDKLGEAEAGAGKLAEGTRQVAAGADQVRQGVADAGSGFRTVTEGTAQLADGSRELAGGVDQLASGSRTLSDKLGSAASESGGVKSGDRTADQFADPVKVSENKLADIPNYGTGMAPYFLSLGLYVGALLSTVILPLRDAPAGVAGGFRWYLSKALLFAPLVLAQTVLVDTILLYGLGLKVTNVPQFYGVTAVIALTFMTILQFLISLADQIGRFVGVILLTLQLASSAGTYPVELLPGWLQAINPWMPMTYAIQAVRMVIAGTTAADLAAPLVRLAVCAAVFIALTLAYAHLMALRGRKASGQTSEAASAS
ncbi:YhgE/Pip domain-containing protein [Cohnella caldifontis]|uniref:YhgE/Pip domain-containing protein n=1 Tax=Cohnella caldifontis TaxID=3027471 RepID=UPI0023EB6EC7|nr:YhgE/Pip domain-containing protein [Cohnella sp. YIM B05605]